MGTAFYAATLLVLAHVVNSYILLTANLDDVHAIAKQVASSPVIHQINKIIRRASNVFNQQMKQSKDGAHLRADPGYQSDGNYQQESLSRSESVEGAASDAGNRVERRNSNDDDLVSLGRNASHYLTSINKIFQNV